MFETLVAIAFVLLIMNIYFHRYIRRTVRAEVEKAFDYQLAKYKADVVVEVDKIFAENKKDMEKYLVTLITERVSLTEKQVEERIQGLSSVVESEVETQSDKIIKQVDTVIADRVKQITSEEPVK